VNKVERTKEQEKYTDQIYGLPIGILIFSKANLGTSIIFTFSALNDRNKKSNKNFQKTDTWLWRCKFLQRYL